MNLRIRAIGLLLVVFVVSQSGCALIVGGREADVAITSIQTVFAAEQAFSNISTRILNSCSSLDTRRFHGS